MSFSVLLISLVIKISNAAPEVLNNHPVSLFALQYDLILIAFSLLVGSYFTNPGKKELFLPMVITFLMLTLCYAFNNVSGSNWAIVNDYMMSRLQGSWISGGISAVGGIIAILALVHIVPAIPAIFEVIEWIVIVASVVGLIMSSYAYWRSKRTNSWADRRQERIRHHDLTRQSRNQNSIAWRTC
uniref:Uncharacterized protein n=2 Tax=Candidatus Kentrum sp. LFY TaxID=2126342 RepID=A0A450UIQ0_9GAMM|nr:MAG: hypothetical protein BECKLFY1418A_GA0070994_10235 [Candidatus Kentron sp. LFY]